MINEPRHPLIGRRLDQRIKGVREIGQQTIQRRQDEVSPPHQLKQCPRAAIQQPASQLVQYVATDTSSKARKTALSECVQIRGSKADTPPQFHTQHPTLVRDRQVTEVPYLEANNADKS